MNMEMIEIMTTVSFAIITDVLSLSFFFPYVCSKSCEMLDADARSCESAVDIVAASIPESIMPAIIAGKIPIVPSTSAI